MSAPPLELRPWSVREPAVDVDHLGVTEALFSLGNGYVGVRGTLDEGEPCEFHGTFHAGVFATVPLSSPEGGYGHPEEGQAMVGVADATPLRLLVDGVVLDLGEQAADEHHRELDLRTGTLERVMRWAPPSGPTVEVRSTRIVSLSHRSVLAVRYQVTALTGPAHVVLRSDLAGVVDRPEVRKDDPRVAEALAEPFEVLRQRHTGTGGVITARTRRSGLGAAAAVDHRVIEGEGVLTTDEADHRVTTTLVAHLAPGDAVTVLKVAGYAWSHASSSSALESAALAAVDAGLDLGWDGLLASQREVLDRFWSEADVEVDGDPELQSALRYNLFQLLCASACTSGAPVGAKGLTGLGYDGHTFWDIEGFVLPALTLLQPEVARRLLCWRSSTLDEARKRAAVLDLQGATFPWRTVDGRECSPYWPASTAAMHLNADISRAFWLWSAVTGQPLEEVGGLEVLVETARLWMSMGNEDADGAWHLFGMTGPDEYTGVVDDNVFTNLMARGNLRRAAAACEAAEDRARELGVDRSEMAGWRAAADAVHVPWDPGLGVHPANDNFTTYREWRFEDKQGLYPVQEHSHYAKIYRRQVIKQADLVLALWWCRDDFTDEELARDLDYYEARTVRDSSLSAAVQAVVCARAGHVDLAHRYLRECALVDLRDLQDDTSDGLHLASVAGAWLALAAGLGGLREDRDELELAPVLPSGLSRVAYHLTWRGRLLHVETTPEGSTVRLVRGAGPVRVALDGVSAEATTDQPVRGPLRESAPLLPEPRQPVGREPRA
jgi:alpha,alpha-trehalose phosphorylase